MRMEGRYVKALYDFSTTETSEISLAMGDVVKVVRQVDANWLCGCLNNKTGNFPASFVAPVKVPSVKPGEKLFQAMRTFPAEESGDLGFSKGEIVLGLEAVDANWWKGRIGDQIGIFPITHVREFDDVQPTAITANNTTSNATAIPSLLRKGGSSSQGAAIATVRAIMDLTAQLDDELSFITGDIIHVTQIMDEDFAIGECGGLIGEFPVAFVEVIEGSLQPAGQTSEKRKSKNKFRWWLEEDGEEESGVSNVPAPQPSPEPQVTASGGQMRNKGGDQNRPTSSIEKSTENTEGNDLVQTHRRLGSYNQENTRSYDSAITPYGKTLYPFIAENPNELTFFGNEIVNLIRHVDEQWMEGEVDGKRGIFPTAYVEIIVDCPYAEDMGFECAERNSGVMNHVEKHVKDNRESQQDVVQQQIEKQLDQQEPELDASTTNSVEKYALVLCDFTPNTERELALSEGDTVTIFCQVDEHWFEVKHDDGRMGLCPSSYVRIIESETCPLPTPAEPATALVPRQDNNNSPKPTDANLPNRRSSGLPETSKISKPKPQPKPKPSPKPKPIGLTARTKSPLTTQEKPSIPARRTSSLDTDNQYVPNPKPVVPTRRLVTNKTSPYQKSSSMDATLDDLIVSEMNALRNTEVPHTGRSRSSSATSDYASIDESRMQASPPVGNDSNPRSPDEKYMHRGTSVGSSMFFATPTSPTTASPVEIANAKPLLERQRPRQTPNRPPPPPMVQAPPQRLNSITARRPPARPTGGPKSVSVPSNVSLENSLVDYGPKPVPSREAPPRPNPAQRPAPSRTPGNLMDFSPDDHQSNGLSDQDREIVADFDNRITEIQKDLEKCMQAQQELEHMVTVTEGSERTEIEENLAFYNANITGLSQEMQELKANLYEVHPERAAEDAAAEQQAADSQRRAEEERKRAEEEKKHAEEERLKRHDKRVHIIEEVIQTERDYLNDLTLTVETFLAPEAEKCPFIDVEKLFGNIDEVIEVSQKLLTLLEGGCSGRDFDKQVIGETFVTLREDLKKVYAPYCRNHDDVIALLEKYDESEEIQVYLTRALDLIRKSITVFDLASLLIKPVQRILKYPLLLNELNKATEDDHVDKQPLLNAINAMTDVAAALNEYKRRKDLVSKYRINREEKLTDKIARLSLHSTRKKLSRITQRMVGTRTVDETYNKEERKIMSLEKGVRSLVRDIGLFIEQLQETVSLQESIANDIADYYGEKSGQQEVQQFCTVHNVIASNLFREFKCNVEDDVLIPLNHLIMLLSGPAKVMKKRHDKLLDYDHAQVKVKSSKDVELRMAQQELNRMKNDYEALNSQLLDDLPRLYDLAIEIVIECIARLITIQKASHQKALEKMFQLLSVPLVLSDDGLPLIEAFSSAHNVVVETLSDICFIPRAFNPQLEAKAAKRMSTGQIPSQESDTSQSEGQRVYLTQVYPPDQLYRVVADTPATQPMDLACTGGSLVGVIKEGDPMGNKERWFIDNGAIKGFILKRHLAPYQAALVAATAGGAFGLGSETLLPRQDSSPTLSMSSDLMDLSSMPRDGPLSGADRSAKAVEAGIASPIKANLELEFLKNPEPCQENVDLSDEGVQAIDWGTASVQPGMTDYAFGVQDELGPPPSYTEAQEVQVPASPTDLFRAIYPFQARAPIEITMEEGQLVKVIMKRDLDGNTEWWLVEVNGKQGYAPSNYLYQITQREY